MTRGTLSPRPRLSEQDDALAPPRRLTSFTRALNNREIPHTVAVKIKLKRFGKVREPHYRVIVADSRNKRDGRAIEELGAYHPKHEPSHITLNSERVQYWLGVGAQPTEPARAILRATGDWQKFKGLPGAEGNLQVPQTSADKTAAFNAALAEAHGQPSTEATTPPKKKATKQSSAKQASSQDSSEQGAQGATTQNEPAGTAETSGGDAEAASAAETDRES
ncbi:MAG TPA: 30S ribosomal protein S16 [Jiangellaceae bacterium]|nr:30S ribosomal protein S16 [Jiangellaceae bacterium]